jgi:Cdc6-like AAA superfamily ATPase
MIFTFYSFKGGVGRSMALANVAELLYRRGLRVLMVDFDLEAPGLERFFEVPAKAQGRRGVIDLVLSYKELRSLPRPPEVPQQAPPRAAPSLNPFPFPVEPLTSFLMPIYEAAKPGGASLSLIRAGRRDGDEFARYTQRVRSLDWDDFYLRCDGERFFDWFRQEAETFADVVLIDSRTGISEMGGVCTYHLADVVLLFVAPAWQNLEGTQIVARSLRNPELIRQGRKGRDLQLLFVPSRVEHAEGKLLDLFKQRFQDMLEEFFPRSLKFEKGPFIELKTPYTPEYAYQEAVAVREPERPVAVELIGAYTRLTTALVNLAPPDSRLYTVFNAPPAEKARRDVGWRHQIAELIGQATKDFTGRDWIFSRVGEWLTTSTTRVLLITGEPGSGKTALAAELVRRSGGGANDSLSPRLEGRATLAFAHFCHADDLASVDPKRFVEALARQLAALHPDFASALVQLRNREIRLDVTQHIGSSEPGGRVVGVWINEVRIGKVSARAAFEDLVARPLEALYASGFGETIVILVDALDEALAYRGGGDNLLQLLSQATGKDLPSRVRFLLTSRNDPRVLRAIHGERVDLSDASANLDDVRHYVTSRLRALAGPPRRVELASLADRIVQASQGNFLYARFALDALLSQPAERWEEVAAGWLPAGLRPVYASLLRPLASDRERWARRDRNFLGALAVAFAEGLTRSQLAGVLSCSRAEISDSLLTWGQLLLGPLPDGPFALYHRSFRDFLLTDEEYLIDPGEAHQMVAGFFVEQYAVDWSRSDDYGLRYAPSHLLAAIQATDGRRERQAQLGSLVALLSNFSFLEAKTARLGVDALLEDLRAAQAVLTPLSEEPLPLGTLLETLEGQTAELRGWDRSQLPALFAELLAAPAAAKGLRSLALAAEQRLILFDRPARRPPRLKPDDSPSPGKDPLIYLNGINALTGQYLVPPLTVAEAADFTRRSLPPSQQASLFRRTMQRFTGRFFGLPMDVDPTDLTQCGWAIVFPSDAPAAVRQALQPLIDLRQKQVPPDRCKVLEYRSGEAREDWLARYNAHGSDVVPIRVPYYVLLVGGPEAIPFEFQFLIDVDYAVGRLAFDRTEDYGRYAQAIVAYETAGPPLNGKELVYWGTRHEGDVVTELSADALVRPLFEGLPAAGGAPAQPAVATSKQYRSRCLLGEEATKANLLEILHSRRQPPPSLLFTASHGMGGWPKEDARQRPTSGALLCQDWPGFGRIKPDHYLAASDLEADARLQGLVAFVFACYGAGTPQYDPFLRDPAGGQVEVAVAPFVAALAQRLLTSGALAVIGHAERAWGYSIQPQGVGRQVRPFRNLIGRVLTGDPVGHATIDLSERYATCSTELLNKLDPSSPAGLRPTDSSLAYAWIERNDAQSYILLGDPAAHLRVDDLR